MYDAKQLEGLGVEKTEDTVEKFKGRGNGKSSSPNSCGGEKSSTSSTSRKVTLTKDKLGVVDDLIKASDY